MNNGGGEQSPPLSVIHLPRTNRIRLVKLDQFRLNEYNIKEEVYALRMWENERVYYSPRDGQ